MNLKMCDTFQIGEIEQEEFEHLIIDVIKCEMPDAVILEFFYETNGIKIRTNLGNIDIEIDWNEISIKEPK
jgi:hypothetical protein